MTWPEYDIVVARAEAEKAAARAALCKWALERARENITGGVGSEAGLRQFECDLVCAEQDVLIARARLALAERGSGGSAGY